jgi:hypothetical protein
MKRCNGLTCKSNAFIKSHVIPKGFGKFIRDDGLPNIQLRWDRVGEAKPQLGEFDTEILCADCDNKLGRFDDYALDVCRRFRTEHKVEGECFELRDVDGEKFAKFVLGVLWRASISERVNFTPVSLGPHEKVARDVLFGALPLSAMPAFQVLLERYTSDKIANVEGFYTHPVRSQKGAPYNFYGFSAGGFRILAKVDARRFPRELRHFVVNDNDALRGTFVKLEDTDTHAVILEMLAKRPGAKPSSV